MSNNEKIVVVTGASTGIGKATAELFKERGFTVINLSRSLPDTKFSRCCDVTNSKKVADVFQKLLGTFEKIDVLVNSAGVAATTDPLQISLEEWDVIFKTNVVGSYLCCQQVLPSMCERRYGQIVNVSSLAGRSYSKSSSVAYTASKYAVIGLTRQLAAHFGPMNIRINCICPSHTETEMLMKHVTLKRQAEIAADIPLKRLAKPKEVAESIFFLASDAASYVNGAILDVNGGSL